MKTRKQLLQLNKSGTVGLSIPARMLKRLGWVHTDLVDIEEKKGGTLIITVVKNEIDFDAN